MDNAAGPSVGSVRSWLQTHLGTLYESAPLPEEADLKYLFYETFSANAIIYYNHERLSPEGLLEQLKAANFACTQATSEWKELIEIPKNEQDNCSGGGIIAGCFVIIRFLKFRIRAGPAQRQSSNIFTAKVEEDPDADRDREGRGLRISQFFITSVDKAVPVHLWGAPAPFETVNPAILEKTSG